MRWVMQFDSLVSVMTDEDLVKAAPHFSEARRMWKEYGRDGGTCVRGAGIGVLYLPPRCRNPREQVVIPSPWQGDGGDSVRIPLNYLARHGIPAFHVAGSMD